MPKAKKKVLWNNFPALERLLEEIRQLREHERVQPSLPFDMPSSDARYKLPLEQKRNRARRTKEKPAITAGKK